MTDGQPEISDQAALIGDWRPMVETIRVLSVGLGGDSEARFKGGQGLALGPRRAVTVAINASLIPFISKLIRSVQKILGDLSISAPLMVVKGDGSLVRAEIALQRPVETVISGPAASVIGACHLSRSQTAIIADMGGTTTDIAIVTDGQPDISNEAALIGDWRPMVETIRVLSVGLGGDLSLIHI